MAATENQQRQVYLVRHGEAISAEVDPSRPLTPPGRVAVERMAAWAATADIRPDEILHSGKLRAEQTAEILADYLMPPRGTSVRRGLSPDDDVRPVADSLASGHQTLMIVGHLPFLGRLASHLVVGDADRPVVQFEEAAVVGLQFQEGHWTIVCVLDPELLP
jgi:phosphohistidine phosphatase